jgi:hypothetical protein
LEVSGQDFVSGIVLKADQGELGSAAFEPVVAAGVGQTLSDSSSPSWEGDRISLQLWGDIILEHLHRESAPLTEHWPDEKLQN